MPDTPSDNPDEQSFAVLMREGARELRELRGPCPSLEVLLALHEDRLTEEEASSIRRHIDACGLCDLQLGRLEGAEPQGRSLPLSFWAILQKPLVPYALVLLLSYPAYRGLLSPTRNLVQTSGPRGSQRSAPEFGVDSIPSLSLDTVRSNSTNAPFVRLSGKDRFLLLSFFVPIKASADYHYTATVVRGDGVPVAAEQDLRNCDSLGNCFLLCNAALFAAGRYTLQVNENDPIAKIALLRLPFVVQAP